MSDTEIFDKWWNENERRFAHAMMDDKQIAYSAFLKGQDHPRTTVKAHGSVGGVESEGLINIPDSLKP